MIHESAVIDKSAVIGKNVEIGPYVVIGENVVLGDNVKIIANAYLEHCEIGEGTVISPFAAIGTAPQDLGYKGELTKAIIGKNCIIKEYVTVHRGAEEGTSTVVGDKCLLMVGTHVAHNCVLENEVIMANQATIGGHVHIGYGCFLGGQSVFHQNIRIGELSIVSGASAARMDILPYTKSEGIPCAPHGINAIGLRRRGFSKEDRDALHKAVRLLTSPKYNTTQAIEVIQKEMPQNKYVDNMIDFIKTSKRGVTLKSKAAFGAMGGSEE